MSRLKTDAIRNVNASVDGITLDTSGNVAIPNKIGINTTSPEDLLHIKTGKIRIENAIVSNNDSTISYDNDTFLVDVDPNNVRGSSQFQIKIDTVSGLIIDDNRRVGIGTTSPRTKLDVTGYIYSNNGSQIQITGNPGAKGLQLIGQDDGTSLIGTMGSSGEHLLFRTASSERMRLLVGGSHLLLGGSSSVNEITESSANAGMVIGGTGFGNGGLAIINSTSGTGRIYFGDAVGSSAARHRGLINYYHNGDFMMFGTAGSEKLRITSDGKVGINIASPSYPLHVNGEGIAIDRNAGDPYISLRTSDDTKVSIYGGASTGFRVFTKPSGGSSAERFRITPDGNVGIGSTNPGCKLVSIQGDASNGNNVILDNNYSNNGTTTFLKAYRVGGLVGYALQYKDSDTRIRQGTYTNHAMELVTNDNARLTLHNDGHARFSNAISFNNETATANRLNDYEEGSWTATVMDSGGGTNISINNVAAKYTKIGNQVTCWFRITRNETGSRSGSIRWNHSLPFTTANDINVMATGTWWLDESGPSSGDSVGGAIYLAPNSNTGYFVHPTSPAQNATNRYLQYSEWSQHRHIYGSFTYYIP